MRLDASIETKRLILRTLDTEDIGERYVGWLNDSRINRFLEVRLVTQTLDSTRDFVARMNDSPNNLLLGMFLKPNRTHIGNIKLGSIDHHHRRGDIGILIGDHSQWGKGFATEAIVAVTEYAMGPMGLHKLVAGYYSDNVASGRAFLKAGFAEEARLRDHWLCEGSWQDEILLVRIRETL